MLAPSYGACKLEWCVSAVSQDVVVGISYVVISSHLAQLLIVLKFILTFSGTV